VAKKKVGGATKGNRDSAAKRLGVKVFGGQKVLPGAVIVRQRGTGFRPGTGCGLGRDQTIFAVRSGLVEFGIKKGKRIVNVVPS